MLVGHGRDRLAIAAPKADGKRRAGDCRGAAAAAAVAAVAVVWWSGVAEARWWFVVGFETLVVVAAWWWCLPSSKSAFCRNPIANRRAPSPGAAFAPRLRFARRSASGIGMDSSDSRLTPTVLLEPQARSAKQRANDPRGPSEGRRGGAQLPLEPLRVSRAATSGALLSKRDSNLDYL